MKREEYIRSLLDTYKLIRVFSQKNGCRVLRLRHKELQKDMVLHSFPQIFEAYEVLSGIQCDNLPEIYDCIHLEDGQIMLEEYIDGLTVAQIMETGKYRYSGAKKIMQGACNALAVLHGFGFVHRDVKPENILVDNNGRVVLIDFNASRKVKPAGHDTVVMGTVGYASPEQLGIAQTDPRSDIYALGVMLNVMITGKHPSECLAKGRVGHIVKNCTNINPNDRYDTVAELLRAL